MAVAQSQIYSLFSEALALETEADRAQYLDHACGDDPAVRARVEALLRAHAAAGGFLGGQSPETLAGDDFPTTASIGTSIGPYKLREVLGEGGMGIVYAAEQEQPIRRKVALKVIKPGMDSKEVIARLEAERQALALMDHPHIAKVMDAGATESGRPYFVMELVRGLPITQYCDQAKLNLRERLRLFISVCQAVQHAHQKGIIHRDLKPSNVMITLHDGTPVPKVIDFGVAKALNQKLTEHTLYTRHAQLLGTPMYMSPEQAELSGLEIDTRSDVYALGVLLYELLTGRTPFDRDSFSQAGYDEQRRIIREEEPPRPSQRVSTLAGEKRTTLAVQRGLDERLLAKSLRGELDWIVMKALEKDRTRRYGSADALAADLQSYLNDQPVQACPPSWTYRMQKFVHRQRGTLSAAALAVCFGLVLAGVIVYIKDRTGKNVASVVVPDGGSVTITDEQKPAQATPTPIPPPRASAPGRYLPGIIPEPTLFTEVGRWQMIPKKPRGKIRSGVWSPDETRFAIAESNNVRIYDASTLQLSHVLVGHQLQVYSVAWHPDGRRLASAGDDHTVRLWNSDGAPTHLLTGHSDTIYQVAWRPDGEQLASASADGTVRLWTADGEPENILDEGHRHVFAIDWHPEGKWLATAGGDVFPESPDHPVDNSVRIWEAASGKLIRKMIPPNRHSGLSLDWRPDGQQLAVGFGDRCYDWQIPPKPLADAGVMIWNSDGTPGPEVGGEFGSAYTVAWHPGGKRLAFGGPHGALVRIWNAEDGSLTAISTHDAELRYLSWNREGTKLLSSSRGAAMGLSEHQEAMILVARHAVRFGLGVLKWSPDGTQVGTQAGYFWSHEGQPIANSARFVRSLTELSADENPVQRPDGTPTPPLDVAGFPPTPYGNFKWSKAKPGYCVGCYPDAIHPHQNQGAIWDDQGKRIVTFHGHRGGLEQVDWSPDGDWVVTGGGDSIRLWRSNGIPGPIFQSSRFVNDVAWSPDGQWIAASGIEPNIRLLRPDGTAGPEFLHGHQVIVDVLAWSPDSQRLATIGGVEGAMLRVWNIPSGTLEWQALLVDGETSVTLSPSGELLHGDRTVMESEFLYLIEQRDGSMEIVSHGEFSRRYGVAFLQAQANQIQKFALEGKDAEAIAGFLRISQNDAIAKVVWRQNDMGDLLLRNKYYSQAADLFSRRIESTGQGHIYKRRGAAYMALKEYDKALADITTAVEMNPGDTTNFTWFPQSLLWESPLEIQDAFLALVTKAIERSPANYAVRAQYYFHRGEFEKGRADIASALEANGNDPKLLNNSAWQFVASDDPELQRSEVALQWAERAVELAPTDGAYWHTLGVARFRQSDWNGALKALEKSMELGSGGSGYDWFFLAMIHWQLGHPDEAAKWYDQSVEWMSQQKPNDELIRFHAEAAKMLGRTTPGQ